MLSHGSSRPPRILSGLHEARRDVRVGQASMVGGLGRLEALRAGPRVCVTQLSSSCPLRVFALLFQRHHPLGREKQCRYFKQELYIYIFINKYLMHINQYSFLIKKKRSDEEF